MNNNEDYDIEELSNETPQPVPAGTVQPTDALQVSLPRLVFLAILPAILSFFVILFSLRACEKNLHKNELASPNPYRSWEENIVQDKKNPSKKPDSPEWVGQER